MDNKYYQEINPLEKEEELLSYFKEYNPRSFGKTDDGYDWIDEDDSKCIVLYNPYYDQNLEVNVGDMGEFTVFFSNHHTHYWAYQSDYEDMVKQITRLLHNESGVAVLKDSAGKWYGSCYIDKDDLDKVPTDLFEFVFKEKSFAYHLTKSGYSVAFDFWNPIDNKTVTVQP